MNRTALAAIPLAVLSATGCASLGSAAATSDADAGQSSAVSTSAPCSTQMAAWRATLGPNRLTIVSDDTAEVGDYISELADHLQIGADTTQDQAQLASAASSLQANSQTAQGLLPPSCVPGMRAADSTYLADAVKASGGTEGAVTELGKSKNAAAVATLLRVRKQLAAASRSYAAAVSDAQGYGGGGS